MPTFSGNIVVSKAVLISGSLMMGTGTVYLLYQMYTFTKQLKRFNCQVTILTERLYRAEADILQLRMHAEQAGAVGDVVSDDADDEFVDAIEEDHRHTQLSNGSLPNSHHGNKEKKSVSKLLEDIDCKTEEGGLVNLTCCKKHLAEISKVHPKNAEIFWRISKTDYLLADQEMTSGGLSKEKYHDLMCQAKKAAEKAIDLNPKSGDPHKWMAIILGSLTQNLPAQDQIKNAFDIKEHIEKAILYMPNDALMHHIMGRWCYSVYMMSWVERKLASVLFATPPTATLQETIDFLQKAENLDPLSSVSNELYLGKAYIAKGDYRKAVKYLNDGKKLQCSSSSDKKAHEEIQTLLQQYKSYAS